MKYATLLNHMYISVRKFQSDNNTDTFCKMVSGLEPPGQLPPIGVFGRQLVRMALPHFLWHGNALPLVHVSFEVQCK